MKPTSWFTKTLQQISANPVSYGVVQTGKYVDGGVPCVRVVDMASGTLSPQKMITTSRKISDSYRRTYLERGDIIIALRGIIGRAVIVDEGLVGCNLTRGVARIAVKQKEYDSQFILQTLNSTRFLNYIIRQATGSALQEISIATLRKATLDLPPLPEQKKIAEILSTWDRAIEVVEKLIANSEAQKKALTQQLLTGNKRLPGFEGEWRNECLSAFVTKIVGGGTPDRTNSEYWDLDIPWASVKDMSESALHHTKEFISQSGLENSSAKLIPKGTVIIATRMAVGTVATSSIDVAINQDLKAIFPNDQLCTAYLFVLMQFGAGKLRAVATGSTVKGIRLDSINNFEVSIPSIDEQVAIASSLSDAQQLVEKLNQSKKWLIEEKSALMQQLLTGTRRVKIDSEAVA